MRTIDIIGQSTPIPVDKAAVHDMCLDHINVLWEIDQVEDSILHVHKLDLPHIKSTFHKHELVGQRVYRRGLGVAEDVPEISIVGRWKIQGQVTQQLTQADSKSSLSSRKESLDVHISNVHGHSALFQLQPCTITDQELGIILLLVGKNHWRGCSFIECGSLAQVDIHNLNVRIWKTFGAQQVVYSGALPVPPS